MIPGGRPVFNRTEQEREEAAVVRRWILWGEVMWWVRRRARWGIFREGGAGGGRGEGARWGRGCGR